MNPSLSLPTASIYSANGNVAVALTAPVSLGFQVTCKTCILDCEWVAVDKRVDNYMALPFNIMANILTAIHENRGPDEVISTTTVSYRTG